MVEKIRAAGGEVYALTSEPQSLATNAQEDWETGIVHVGDPHQEILAECREREWISVFTGDWGNELVADGNDWVSHLHGYFQPGVLALDRSERVLYRWRCRPNRANAGGAVARPAPEHVWSRLEAALSDPPGSPDVAHDEAPVLDTALFSWPVFVAALFANGWFLKPVPFTQRPGEDTVPQRIRNALFRLPIFAAAWFAMFAFLPWWIPTLALAVWIAKIWPWVRVVNARFQNVQPDEEPR